MHLTFGMYLDGARWSDKQASSGELQLGPFGMLSMLETRLGLGGPEIPHAERINQYMHRLKAANRKGKWFHVSFEADAWSTAKQMLAWRDELIEVGWKGQADKSSTPRLQVLAELELIALPLGNGQEDRLQEVLQQLEHTSKIDIGHIYLQEGVELLPHAWQKVFKRLQGMGVSIGQVDAAKHRQRFSNLATVQSVFSSGTNGLSISENDDSLLLVKATDEWEAAENLAVWLSANTGANQGVTIICGADTDVLDQALKRHGLPQIGVSESSRWRAYLQVLPLVLANLWKPVDIHRLVELLSLTISPIPWFAANRLLKALSKEPGVGGGAWQTALKDIAVKREDITRKKGTVNAESEASEFVAELDAFLATDRYEADSGIPEDKFKERCRWVAKWLARQIEYDLALKEAHSHAREMQKLAEGKGIIPRVAVERMLDSVIGVGKSAPDRVEQAAGWQVVSHPGQINKPERIIIWWGFTDTSAKPPVYWSESERNSLLPFGIRLEDSRIYRSREANAWKQGLSHAVEHLLLFYPEKMQGEDVYCHPFWDEIHNAAIKSQPDQQEEDVVARLIRECKKLHDKGQWKMAGRRASLQKAEKHEQKKLEAVHVIPAEAVRAPASLSYSQISTMIGCPMKWTLQYHAGLRPPDMLSVPTGNQMMGTFCHLIIQKLYAAPVRQWTPDGAEAKAGELYDLLVGSMASELLLVGKELDNKRYRLAVMRAVRQLVAAIVRLGLTMEKSEEKLKNNVGEIPFEGYADMVLRDKQGNFFVLDLKWTVSSRYKKEEIEEGNALQLAVYSWLLRSLAPASLVHSGYFMLAQGELLSDSDLLGHDALYSKYPLKEIWDRGIRSWTERFQTLKSGKLEASGVSELLRQSSEGLDEKKLQSQLKSEYDAKRQMYQKPPCNFCDFSILCGMPRGDA